MHTNEIFNQQTIIIFYSKKPIQLNANICWFYAKYMDSMFINLKSQAEPIKAEWVFKHP